MSPPFLYCTFFSLVKQQVPLIHTSHNYGTPFDEGESVVERTDTIHEAISLDLQLSFKYFHYYPSFKDDNRSYSKNGEPYVVSPFALYWSNGNYYLYAYVSEKNQMRFFRIDRMESIRLASTKREGHDLFSAATLQSKRKAKVFDMYTTGNEVNVTLRGINQVADQIIDAFGNKTMLIPDKKDGYFTANVLVDVSPTFFAWLSTFGMQLKITAPNETKKAFQEFLHKALDQY